jgi:hypothetical protein
MAKLNPVNLVGNVISLPVERTLRSAQDQVVQAARRMSPFGSWTVDDWGRDPTLADAFTSTGRRYWSVMVGGAEKLPARGGAMVVINSRRYAFAPLMAALALTDVTGRPARFVGRPDTAPFGALARRLGGLLARPDEVNGALRSGELLVLGAQPVIHPRRVGRVDHLLVGPAVLTGAKVYPAAVASSPLRRGARVEIGRQVRPNRHRRGPLAELELADVLEREIARLLGELGGTKTGTVLDWLPISGMGGGS